MGANQSGRDHFQFDGTDVNFDHFHILRAIGKGSFGKVCIVQKKDTKQMFAMKYMNKAACAEREALRNVLREVELLTQLDHPFLVNLWFSFQDEEDLFMVSDLLLGGDLRFHIQHQVLFSKESVVLMVYELATALDYLHGKRILHRDIKPDNILLDEEGHAHITDFNIATQLGEMELATSMSGTKPYMSPEIFDCAADACVGYSFPIDWWSLGVVAYEMIAGERPYDIHSQTGVSDVRQLFLTPFKMPHGIDRQLGEVIKRLLTVSPGARCSSMEEMKKMAAFSNLDYEAVLQKQYKPEFCPPKDHLNCDPTFELEEMIVEAKPLHKKKKRLAKQKSMREIQIGSLDLDSQNSPPIEPCMQNIIPEFINYNRYKEIEKKELERRRLEREKKEKEWEKELATAMGETHLDSKTNDDPNECGKRLRTQDGCDILVNSNECEYADDNGESVFVSGKTVEKTNGRKVKFERVKFVSESDFMNMKKKCSKITFGSKDDKNISRAGSLKEPKDMNTYDQSKTATSCEKIRTLDDNVKNKITSKLKHPKAETDYQKVKKNHLASLNSALKNEDR